MQNYSLGRKIKEIQNSHVPEGSKECIIPFQKRWNHWGLEEMWETFILNEKENIYYLKTKPSHTKQIWINITLDCLEDALGQ